MLSSSFLLGFFSILRYKLICNKEQFHTLKKLRHSNSFQPALNDDTDYETAGGVSCRAEPTEK